LSAVACFGATRATAGFNCDSRQCVASVDLSRFTRIYAAQEMSNWCWAASLSMLFNYYGYPVRQERIVEEVYGQLLNGTATTLQMSQQVNRNWFDDSGRQFAARLVSAYDYEYGVNALDNNTIINALVAEHPLLFANETHATVLTSVAYAPAPPLSYAPGIEAAILNAVMFDPWPGIGERAPQVGELVAASYGGKMRYLALAQIQSY
jgi:hypothetical protein